MKNYIILIILLLLLNGCSNSIGNYSEARASLDSKYLYEIIDPLEGLKIEIKEFPPSFDVPIADSLTAADRLNMFFKDILSSKDVAIGQNTVTGQKIIQGSSANYKFLVTSRTVGQQVKYLVQCVSINLGTPEQADLNARNLARFIRDGQLEKMLLER